MKLQQPHGHMMPTHVYQVFVSPYFAQTSTISMCIVYIVKCNFKIVSDKTSHITHALYSHCNVGETCWACLSHSICIYNSSNLWYSGHNCYVNLQLILLAVDTMGATTAPTLRARTRGQGFQDHNSVNTVRTMTSSNGNIFRVTVPLCGEFTSHLWIPLTKASDAEFWCFLWSAHE